VMHDEAFAYVRRTLAKLPPRQWVLDVGGRNVNGSPRELVSDASYQVLDIEPGEGVDIVADASTWNGERIVDEGGQRYHSWPVYDTISCCEVLEHTPAGEAIVRNAHDLLEPGGVLIMTMATEPRPPHSGHDGAPLREGEYYANVRPPQLWQWLRPFASRVLERDAVHGDLYAVAVKGG
jgi:SAM-dependent methyltransferase